MAKRKSKKSRKPTSVSGHSAGTPKVIWDKGTWEKLAERFAGIEIRHQQGGHTASFKSIMTEAQGFLPSNQQRPYLGSYVQTNHGFQKLVAKAREKILAEQKASVKANGHAHGKINGATMEVLATPGDKMGYEIPPTMTLNANLREALKKAGFQFIVIDGVKGVQDVLGSRVDRIERLATT